MRESGNDSHPELGKTVPQSKPRLKKGAHVTRTAMEGISGGAISVLICIGFL